MLGLQSGVQRTIRSQRTVKQMWWGVSEVVKVAMIEAFVMSSRNWCHSLPPTLSCTGRPTRDAEAATRKDTRSPGALPRVEQDRELHFSPYSSRYLETDSAVREVSIIPHPLCCPSQNCGLGNNHYKCYHKRFTSWTKSLLAKFILKQISHSFVLS